MRRTIAVFEEEGGATVEELLHPYNEYMPVPRYCVYTKEELIHRGRKKIEDYTQGTYAEYKKDPKEYAKKHPEWEHLRYLREDFPNKIMYTDEEVYEEEKGWYLQENVGEKGEVYTTYNPRGYWGWYKKGVQKVNRLRLLDGSFTTTERVAVKEIDTSLNQKTYARSKQFWEKCIEVGVQKGRVNGIEVDLDYYINKYKTKDAYAMSKAMRWPDGVVLPTGEWRSYCSMGWYGSPEKDIASWLKEYTNYIEEGKKKKWNLILVECQI